MKTFKKKKKNNNQTFDRSRKSTDETKHKNNNFHFHTSANLISVWVTSGRLSLVVKTAPIILHDFKEITFLPQM